MAQLLTVKKSVTLREDIAAEAEARSADIGFSAYTAKALEDKLRFDKLSEIVQSYEQQNGKLPNELIPQVYEDISAARAAALG